MQGHTYYNNSMILPEWLRSTAPPLTLATRYPPARLTITNAPFVIQPETCLDVKIYSRLKTQEYYDKPAVATNQTGCTSEPIM